MKRSDFDGTGKQGGAQRSGLGGCRFGCAVLLILFLLSAVVPSPAQATGSDANQPGNFAVGPEQKIGRAALASPERQAALSIAAKLQAILERNPAIIHPTGYSLRIQRAYGKRTDWADFDSGLPYYAGVFGTFFAPDVKPSSTHFANPEFGIYVNTVLQCPMQEFTPPWADNAAWRLGDLPVLEGGHRTGDFHGYPVYDGQCVVVSHSSQPPFRPLTQEEFLRLQISDFKAKLDKMHKQFAGQPVDPSMRDALASMSKQIEDQISQLEQQLASMDAGTRQAPAAVRTGYEKADLVSPEAEGAVPLSVPNPAFLDPSLPPTQVQVIALFLPFVQSSPRAEGLPAGLSPDWKTAMQRIRDGMDWAAIGSLIP